MPFRHFTNKDGKEGIQNFGGIKASNEQNGDAAFGVGVYVTKISPEEGKEKILINNYGTPVGNEDKADHYFEFSTELIKSKIEKAETNRDVYVYKASVLPLDKCTKISNTKK